MIPEDLIADLRSRINPVYSAQLGTESYERRLCAEALESMVEELRAADNLCERMADILRRTAVALKGSEAPLHSHGWHDLPEVAEQMAANVQRLRKVMFDAWEDTDWLLIANEVHDMKTPNAE